MWIGRTPSQETCCRVEELEGRGQEAAIKGHSMEAVGLSVRTLKAYCSMY